MRYVRGVLSPDTNSKIVDHRQLVILAGKKIITPSFMTLRETRSKKLKEKNPKTVLPVLTCP